MTNLRNMREWWEDLLINLAGGVGAALIAAAVLAGAARVAKLWEEDEAFNPDTFIKFIAAAAGVVSGIVAAVAVVVPD